MRIVHYPHPALKRVAKPLRRVDAELQRMVREMFDLMYANKGIGLAANQVDLPYRMFVLNLTADPNEKAREQVFINPVVSQHKGSSEADEGCLSLPGVFAPVRRPETVTINAYDLSGQEIKDTIDGLYARAVQHEVDHLDGVMFTDRLSPTSLMAIREEMDEFDIDYASKSDSGEIPKEAEIIARLEELERERT